MSNSTLEILLYIATFILLIGVIALSVEVIRLRKSNLKTPESDQKFESEKNRLRQEISMMDTNIDILKIIKEHNESNTDQED